MHPCNRRDEHQWKVFQWRSKRTCAMKQHKQNACPTKHNFSFKKQQLDRKHFFTFQPYYHQVLLTSMCLYQKSGILNIYNICRVTESTSFKSIPQKNNNLLPLKRTFFLIVLQVFVNYVVVCLCNLAVTVSTDAIQRGKI